LFEPQKNAKNTKMKKYSDLSNERRNAGKNKGKLFLFLRSLAAKFTVSNNPGIYYYIDLLWG